MDTGARWKIIVDTVETHGFISVAKLAKQLSVSEMTIRRDLSNLEGRGQLKRIHGGATKASSRSLEPPFKARSATSVEEKKCIAQLAADLVMDGDTIALDVGSSTMELAKLITGRQNLTVLTPSLHIAYYFISYPNIRVILPGGVLRPHEGSLIGSLPENILGEFFVDKFFLGTGGMDIDAGFTDYSLEDSAVKRVLSRNATEIIALVDSSKIGKVCLNKICSVEDVNTIVLSSDLPVTIKSRIDNYEIEIITPKHKTEV